MDFPKQHLGHSYGPAPTNDQLGISNRISGSLEAVNGLIEIEPDDHIVAAVKKLLADGYKGQDLWNILTALRGPDEVDSLHWKASTTGVIRHTLGLKNNDVAGFLSNEDSLSFVGTRTVDESEHSHHFTSHARYAFESLGLNWDEVNS